jgi:hypothetical protein
LLVPIRGLVVVVFMGCSFGGVLMTASIFVITVHNVNIFY